MDSADENRLAAALEHGTTVLHANASTMTNSDSCHDWTGDFNTNSRPNALTRCSLHTKYRFHYSYLALFYF